MINRFRGKYIFLSNFYPCEIKWKGVIYPSVENAFQSEKSQNKKFKELCSTCSPSQAKKLGKTVTIDKKIWDTKKVNVMKELLKIKFLIPELKNKLLQTENQELVEGNMHYDAFWGIYLPTNCGKNVLGNLLMEIRNEIREEEAT